MKHFLFSYRFLFVTTLLSLAMAGCKNTSESVAPDTEVNSTNEFYARTASQESFQFELAHRWAPVHYQDVDVTGKNSLSGKSDYITAIDFDGDWIATNNWNNISSRSANAHVYYSVVETSTHWFVTYAFFHARDWTDNPFEYYLGEHENDLEGFLSIVKRDGSQYGTLQGIITVAHSDFYSFVPTGSPLQSNYEDIDGKLTMENYNGQSRPTTAQEAKGHGLKANPYYKINGDGIRYLPSYNGIAEVPANANDRDVTYKLVDMFKSGGLWDQRNNSQLFNSNGGFHKSYGNGGANAPWSWNDGNDGPINSGELATDPAKVADRYFKNLGSFSFSYQYNPYKGIN